MKFSVIQKARSVLLYGFGVEGRSSHGFLKARFPSAKFWLYQDGDIPEEAGVETVKQINWDDYDLIVKSPGIPLHKIPKNQQTRLTSNYRLFVENLPKERKKKFIGITGSKGKSTNTKFTAQLLENAGFKVAAVGNLGQPFLEVFDDFCAGKLDFVIGECSSFQLADSTVSPGVAMCLSLFPDHLNWHEGWNNYLEAKSQLWTHQQADDQLFVPKSNKDELDKLFQTTSGQIRHCPSLDPKLFPAGSILQAPHFCQNLGLVWGLAKFLSIPDLKTVWQKTAADFTMLPHRLEHFHAWQNLAFYNDSIATSPDATIAAANFFGSDLSYLILGGVSEGNENFNPLIKTVKDQAPIAEILILDSPIKSKILTACQQTDFKKHTVLSDLDAILKHVKKDPRPGVCLLSPGGKSFDSFASYSERGEVFKRLVRASF